MILREQSAKGAPCRARNPWPAAAGRGVPVEGGYMTFSSSTSKIRVSYGPMALPAPFAP